MESDDERQLRALMIRAQDGDGEAYGSLLTAVLPTLRKIAGRRLSNRDTVEDVVQEILLSVHAGRHTYTPDLPLMPWLRTIAERRVADCLRKHYRRGAHEVTVEDYPETFDQDGANNYEEGALSYATDEGLRAAIAKLPEGQRQAVELLKLRELSLKEAAAQSGMSVPALKVAMHRAMKRLRVLLDV